MEQVAGLGDEPGRGALGTLGTVVVVHCCSPFDVWQRKGRGGLAPSPQGSAPEELPEGGEVLEEVHAPVEALGLPPVPFLHLPGLRGGAGFLPTGEDARLQLKAVSRSSEGLHRVAISDGAQQVDEVIVGQHPHVTQAVLEERGDVAVLKRLPDAAGVEAVDDRVRLGQDVGHGVAGMAGQVAATALDLELEAAAADVVGQASRGLVGHAPDPPLHEALHDDLDEVAVGAVMPGFLLALLDVGINGNLLVGGHGLCLLPGRLLSWQRGGWAVARAASR